MIKNNRISVENFLKLKEGNTKIAWSEKEQESYCIIHGIITQGIPIPVLMIKILYSKVIKYFKVI